MIAVGLGISFWWRLKSARQSLDGYEETSLMPKRPVADYEEPEPAADPVALLYSEQEFQEMVANALDAVPAEFDSEWENVAVVVSTGWVSDEDKARMHVRPGHVVFGTYSGIGRTQGLRSQNSSRHVITIYQPALELSYGSDKVRLEQEIRRVVLHELAHHLGMSHARMKEIGL